MSFDLCPICGTKMKTECDYMDNYILLEEHKKCVNPKCSGYYYDYVTGYSSVYIVDGEDVTSTESGHIKNSPEKHYKEWSWTYTTEDKEKHKEWKSMDEYIEEMRNRYRAKYGPYDNPILDCLEID